MSEAENETEAMHDDGSYLHGKMLFAMPGIGDSRFERSVIYLCVHNADGAMGIIVNKQTPEVHFPSLLEQLDIEIADTPPDIARHCNEMAVLAGGPVETGRGFVLHTLDYCADDSTLPVTLDIGLTATVDILKAIAVGDGPSRAIFSLGYAGWAPGQLEQELQVNGWLHCDADNELIFGTELDGKYEKCLSKLGIDLSMLSAEAGRA